ncbi:MAG TPA: S8 family serine peptidase [Steroidobacteraceae bacterium]|nr:S8 family serine peptidase [Steroidobacteraceae bacterium]
MSRKKSVPFAVGGLALLALLAADAADSVVPIQKPAARSSGGAQLMAFGGRSAAHRETGSSAKLDAALADLSRHLNRVRSERALEDLHALSPAARFMASTGSAAPLVAVDAVTRGDPARLKQALLALGLQHPAVYANDVGGWLPVNQIVAAGALGELVSIRASMPRARAVKASSQGDFAQYSDVVRANNAGLTGAGVTVGIISDSFDCYGVYDKPGSGVPASGVRGYAPFGFATDDAAFDETNDYLPASVNVLEEAPNCLQYGQPWELPFADEGRAMMQIVHDVAPGATLAFHTGSNSEADFAAGIGALATAGATVIADDIGYFDEPFFQDGIVAQAIDDANAKGVAYFSAAGNNADLSYENHAPSFATAGSGANAGEMLLTFGMNGGTPQTFLQVDVPAMFPGEFMGLIVQWDQPYVTGAPGSPGASSQIDLCVTGAPANTVLFDLDGNQVTCSGPNAFGVDAVQVLILGNPASNNSNTAAQTVNIVIGLKNGSPAPGLIKLVVADDGAGSTIDQFATQSPTLQGHPGAAGAAAVGASWFWQTPRCGETPAALAPYSSWGGDAILFDAAGHQLSPAPPPRQKPDFVGPDGVNTSFFGFSLAAGTDTSAVGQCANAATYNNFFGTSAATPHVAAVAALMLQANSALTPAQIFNALQKTALPMGNVTPDYLSGYGFIQADAALGSLPPGPPTMTLAAATVKVGGSTSLTWAAYNVTSCNASGSWSGAQQPTGSLNITPSAVGTQSYALTCSNPHGSAQKTATLTVQAAPAGGGGGGGLDAATLIALIALGCARALQARMPGEPMRG